MSNEEKLAGAAFSLKQVGDTSIPVILNIIGNKKWQQSSHTDVAFSSHLSNIIYFLYPHCLQA